MAIQLNDSMHQKEKLNLLHKTVFGFSEWNSIISMGDAEFSIVSINTFHKDKDPESDRVVALALLLGVLDFEHYVRISSTSENIEKFKNHADFDISKVLFESVAKFNSDWDDPDSFVRMDIHMDNLFKDSLIKHRKNFGNC